MNLDQVVNQIFERALEENNPQDQICGATQARFRDLIKEEMRRFGGRSCFNLLRILPPLAKADALDGSKYPTPANQIKQAVEQAEKGLGLSPVERVS